MGEFFDGQIAEICRTCLKYGEEYIKPEFLIETVQLHSIFDSVNDCENKKISIHELLNKIMPRLPKVEIQDTLPKTICTDCLKKLKCCQEFQECCLKSDLHLRNSTKSGHGVDNLQYLSDPLLCSMDTMIKQEEEFIMEPNNISESEEQIDENNIRIPENEEVLKRSVEVIEPPLENEEANGVLLNPITDRLWCCDNCSVCFLHKSDLLLHYKQNSSTCREEVKKLIKESFVCDQCRTTFTEKRSLQRHMRRLHNVDNRTTTKKLDKNKNKTIMVFTSKFNENGNFLTMPLDLYDSRSNPLTKLESEHSLNSNITGTIQTVCDVSSEKETAPPKAEPLEKEHDSFSYDIPEGRETILTFSASASSMSSETVRLKAEPFKNDSFLSVIPEESEIINTIHFAERNVSSEKESLEEPLEEKNDSFKSDIPEGGSSTENFEMWECKICHKLFCYKTNLRRHMKTIHNAKLPDNTEAVSGIDNFKIPPTIYKCDECDRVFNKIASLNLHKHHHSHSGAPNICQYCNKSFKKLYKLKDHERTHHNHRTPIMEKDSAAV